MIMRLEVNRVSFLRDLESVLRIAPEESPKKVIRNALLNVDGGGSWSLTATNIDVTVSVSRPKQGTYTPGRVLLSPRVAAILKEGSADTVSLRSEGSGSLEVSAWPASYEVATEDADAFPDMPGSLPVCVETTSADLTTMIRRVAFASARGASNSNHVMDGVRIEAAESEFRLVATDTLRLSFVSREAAVLTACKCIIPTPALRVVASSIKGMGEETQVDIGVSKNAIQFTCESMTITCRLREGVYPPYEPLLEDSRRKVVVKFDRAAMLEKVRQAGIMAEDKAFSLWADGSQIEVESKSDLGRFVGRLPATVKGPGVKLRINARHLAEYLQSVEAETVEMRCEQHRPMTFTAGKSEGKHVMIQMNEKAGA
jgi:DNA polymerase III sliding clamp (beta) subunit (PCNA family)